jgi:hypothetical protein
MIATMESTMRKMTVDLNIVAENSCRAIFELLLCMQPYPKDSADISIAFICNLCYCRSIDTFITNIAESK